MKMVLTAISAVLLVVCANTALGETTAPQETNGKTSTPTPFEAVYTAKYNGSEFAEAATRKLERLPTGLYRHSYRADHLLYSLHEESMLELKGCQVKPQSYSTERGNILKRKKKHIEFLWDTNTARYNDDGDKGMFKVEPGAVDPMSAHLQIACQATEDLVSLTLQETDDDHVEPREYRLLGKETLKTANGEVAVIRMERVHSNKARRTYIWLLAENPVVVVRVWQKDTNDSVYELELDHWKPLPAK